MEQLLLAMGNKNYSSWSLRPWPQERAARAVARSACAEMHSGFGTLRSQWLGYSEIGN